MANLKHLRTRIGSIKSTQKITAAMKLVAGVKFRKSEEEAKKGRYYANAMQSVVRYLGTCRNSLTAEHQLLIGSIREIKSVAVIVYASDKGLCGSFNEHTAKESIACIKDFLGREINVSVFCIGTKIVNNLRKSLPNARVEGYSSNFFSKADGLKSFTKQLLMAFYKKELDQIFLIYNHFLTVMNTELRFVQIAPVVDFVRQQDGNGEISRQIPSFGVQEAKLTAKLLEHNFLIQLKQAGKESGACENSIRMTAMDNATKSAQEMVEKLVLTYNRTRQAVVTGELIEIISGAEAL
ncbi:MAG: ATP synthase F1 subunit gamma [Holosporales bacterium]|jgi:F-type H+-transporting ATPase subunit gamma|nr:ATP synthase F1 subunit gamma [Holosporales bacterium]